MSDFDAFYCAPLALMHFVELDAKRNQQHQQQSNLAREMTEKITGVTGSTEMCTDYGVNLCTRLRCNTIYGKYCIYMYICICLYRQVFVLP